ncbi:MAG TPA: hypothetical protein VGN19_04735, partial [Pedococcus sp.]|nr:hypothetical protein [Pedococcus sp.]
MKASKVLAAVGVASALVAAGSPAFASNGVNSNELLKHGAAMRTVHAAASSRTAQAATLASEQMTYHGGQVQTAPKVYVVYYGSQWGSAGTNGLPTTDPSGVAP